MPPERVHESPSRPSTVWIVVTAVGVMLVAANLRPAVVSVAPLVSDIRHSTGFSSGTAGLLTTLPILFFGLVARSRRGSRPDSGSNAPSSDRWSC